MACDAVTQIGQAMCKPVGPGRGPRNGTGFRATGTPPQGRGVSVNSRRGPGGGVRSTTMAGPRGSVTKLKGL